MQVSPLTFSCALLNYDSNTILDLITSVSELKKQKNNVAYLHIGIKDDSDSLQVGEIEQVLEFKFGKQDGAVYKFDDKNLVIMLASNQSRVSLAHFDKILYENFGRDAIQVTTNTLNESGIHLLATLIERILPENDDFARLALRRMRRVSNCVLVLDDDPMVLKTMENILRTFGTVEIADNSTKFMSLYREYAPNIIFVDIHLKKERGPDIVKKIRAEIDPHVHAIMISSDGTRETVLDVKDAGVHGFLVKPFNRDTVYRHLLKAPTFVPKNL